MPPKVRLNLVVDSELEEKFRNTVFQSKGMRKGNISDAIEEAIEMWIQEQLKTPAEKKVKSK